MPSPRSRIRASGFRIALLLALAAGLAGCSSQDFGTPMGGITDVVDSRKDYLPGNDSAVAQRRAQQIANALLSWQRQRGNPEEDYAVGADDLLAVTIYDIEKPGEPATFRLPVTQDGLLQLPLVGATPVRGMTAREAEQHIRNLYAGGYLKDPRVTVEVADYRSAPVVVTGAVGKPGVYYLRQNSSTVLEMLSLAQGLTISAGQNLLIVRNGAISNAAPQIISLSTNAVGAGNVPARTEDADAGEDDFNYDFSQYHAQEPAGSETNAAATATVGVATGAAPVAALEPTAEPKRRFGWFRQAKPAADTNTLPATPNAVTAEATAPGAEAETAALATADGTGAGDSASPEMITVDLRRLLDEGDIQLNATVLGGDILTIPARKARHVYVLGYVQRAGSYEIEAGHETIPALQAVALAGGLASAARAQKSVLIRETGTSRQVVAVDLTKIARGTRPPVFMQAGDTLVVGSTWLAKLGEFIKPSVSAGASVTPGP